MFKNYLLVTFRNLLKNRVFTIINIVGLGIALSVCIVAFFNHMFNYEFDRTHENFDKIYRITSFRDMQGREQEYGIVPATLGLEIKKDIPGIEKSARLARSGSPVKVGDNIFPTQISYVDPDFLEIFTFPILLGDKKSIGNHGNVLLSRKIATTLFGNEYPIGKTLSIVNDKNKEFTYTVGGVFADLPENSSFRIDILTHFDNFLSIMALVMGIVFAKNAKFQKTLNLGYDRDKLIVMPMPPEYFTSFRNDILSNPRIISAEGTQNHIGFGGYRRPVKDEEKQLEVDVLDIGPGYPATMGLRLVEGRQFDELRAGADRANKSIIVNRKLVNDFGWKEAVGKTITVFDTLKFTVIGVVEDFYINGLWQEIEPAVLRLSDTDQYGILVVRAKPEDLPGVLEYLSSKWKSRATNFIFGGMLQEDTMQEEKDINGSIMKVNIFLAIVATLLSIIGMYNLVSLDIIRRTKEMGIRKIQGASVPLIMFLVSKKYLIVLVIASVLGCIGGYYMLVMLLDSIWDYFVGIKIGILLLASSIMFVATILTIIFKISRAAMKNPVVSLRYE